MLKKRVPAAQPLQQGINSFEIVEAYKTLRTNLQFAMASAERKIVVISSPEPHTGKSTVSSHLAVMMAQTNRRVLLIDADLRRPSLHRVFRVGRTEGLTGHLLNRSNWENCLCKEVAPHLDLMTSGPIPPNPSELLGSVRMMNFLQQASEKYDYVFIDTSPVNVVTDALMLSAHAAGTVLVARQNQTAYDDLNEAIEHVRHVNGNLIGVVISDYRPMLGGEKQKPQVYKQYGYGTENTNQN